MRPILALGTLLVLLIPGVGGAREAWGQQPHSRLSLIPETPVGDASSWSLSRALRSTYDSREVSTKERPSIAIRLAAETLLGGVAGLSGVLVGGLGSILVSMATDDHSCVEDTCGLKSLEYVVWGVGVGVAFTAPLGVYLAGHMLDGEGLLLPTLVGSLVSEAVTIVVLVATHSYDSPAGGLVMLTPLVGSIISYEVSHFFVSRAGQPEDASGVQVVPTAGVTRSGTGVFGLAGRF